MKVHSVVVLLCSGLAIGAALNANETLDRAHQMEDTGNSSGAREILLRAVESFPSDAELQTGYAEFLERNHNSGARDAYRRSADLWKAENKTADAAAARKRAVIMDLVAGDRAGMETDFREYQELGGNDLTLPSARPTPTPVEKLKIPGPFRSFARMAAISPDSSPADILQALARNVVMSGYSASRGSDQLVPTEYLKLVQRYLSQVRELDQLAGSAHMIRVPNCDSTQTNDLLRVLGYRMRGGCGSEVVLETVNASRAFLTTDSGFPLAELEQALQKDQPFSYDYKPTEADVLYSADYWTTAKEKAEGGLLEALLGDPALCRFYLGMSKLDPETALTLRKSISITRLRAFSATLDFFGGNFEIRDGKAIVPGGVRAMPGWADLAGTSPDKGADFIDKLMSRDDGWLAGLYDALARISGPTQEYLTEPARMKRFYAAIRGKITTPGPARPVFRSNADLMLLTTQLQLDANGKPHIPGGLEVWKGLFSKGSRDRYDLKISSTAANWKDPDDVVEALFALCRKPVENEPLRIFMALTDVDRHRAHPLEPATVERMAHDWTVFGSQYINFSESPNLTDKTIMAWLDTANALDRQRDSAFRQDAIAMYQGLTGLWQIFTRQRSIPQAKADAALFALTGPFAVLKNGRDLFDAGRRGLNDLLLSAGSDAKKGTVHDRVLSLLAGGDRPEEAEAHAALVRQEQRFFDAQKLFSPDTVFELADNLDAVGKGEKLNTQLATRLVARLNDIQLPRASMTFDEKNAQAFGYWVNRHIDDQRRLNLRAMIDKGAKDPEKLKDIRGELSPALRDIIVGYNYVRFAPPGAQLLLTNPLFVRGHDFVGAQGANHAWQTTSMYSSGWPNNAGGRLIGSLSSLPYALAEAEKDFLVPTQTQALIWGDLVPQMILSATSTRFWDVTPVQMHWVALSMRHADAMIAEATVDTAVRGRVLEAVKNTASLSRADEVIDDLAAGDAHAALDLLTPSELYHIGQSLMSSADVAADPGARELAHYRQIAADQVSPEAISRAWGTPKPTLAYSYQPELLNLRTFPTLMGYSSRIMAESWESNQLYWAAIADETNVPVAQLNLLIPQWTQYTVERIFASHLEDWQALLRSLRSVGEDIRAGKLLAQN